MEINVSQLLKEPIGASREYKINEALDITEDIRHNSVSGDVSLLRTQQGILVKAKLHTEITLTCSRCLSMLRYPLDISFEEEYIQTIDVNNGLPLETSREPDSFTIDEHHIIDLREAIRQYAMLLIPMKPLCRSDCTGLCRECGRNLNEGACDCPVKTVDPRWSKLLNLR